MPDFKLCCAAMRLGLAIALTALPASRILRASAQSSDAPVPQNAVAQAGMAEAYVQFVFEDDANCQLRDGQHVLVRNSHPSRSIRVWMDRFVRNVGTGDRSRSDLVPHGEAEPLGCSTNMDAKQEWRIVRAVFID